MRIVIEVERVAMDIQAQGYGSILSAIELRNDRLCPAILALAMAH